MREKILYYRYWLMGAGVIVLILFFVGFQLYSSSKATINHSEEWLTSSVESTESTTLSESQEMIYVDVKGAVLSPGIYPAEEQMRVWDVLELAGGITEQADERQINLSLRVKDQMVIYVPEIGEETDFSMEYIIGEADSSETGKLDLNTATEQELTMLSGIGQKKAQDIINYREAQGGFSSVDELTNISGFGAKTLEKIREFVYVS
ncbi:helix-hairpin-helix domain-containing protein [Enterococcus sp. BWR-S5]|uniref:helix-hairpin-helix domain-containing protein n=1 Tax=Enterococcus sp. BWR-S5 TaxID=2787714 RepID=UPI001923F1D9|nr:helix-hairpin-helix domain-containing protein [Enterococcus sp. BWR-S5]MBL1225959.1 helix-hairpin-helix domain-containing protein [Enterococcus sp. BWR-S5]